MNRVQAHRIDTLIHLAQKVFPRTPISANRNLIFKFVRGALFRTPLSSKALETDDELRTSASRKEIEMDALERVASVEKWGRESVSHRAVAVVKRCGPKEVLCNLCYKRRGRGGGEGILKGYLAKRLKQ